MDKGFISRRTLLAAAASAVGGAVPAGLIDSGDRLSSANNAGKFHEEGSSVIKQTRDAYATLFGVYNVKTYGAAGDAVKDDAPAIAAAIAAVPKQGGIVYF